MLCVVWSEAAGRDEARLNLNPNEKNGHINKQKKRRKSTVHRHRASTQAVRPHRRAPRTRATTPQQPAPQQPAPHRSVAERAHGRDERRKRGRTTHGLACNTYAEPTARHRRALRGSVTQPVWRAGARSVREEWSGGATMKRGEEESASPQAPENEARRALAPRAGRAPCFGRSRARRASRFASGSAAREGGARCTAARSEERFKKNRQKNTRQPAQ